MFPFTYSQMINGTLLILSIMNGALLVRKFRLKPAVNEEGSDEAIKSWKFQMFAQGAVTFSCLASAIIGFIFE